MGLNDVFDKGGMMKKKGKREEKKKNMGESHSGCCLWCWDSMPIYTAGGKVTSLVCVCVCGRSALALRFSEGVWHYCWKALQQGKVIYF